MFLSIIKGALISELDGNMRRLTIIITLFGFALHQSPPKECACECCLDDNENCTPTFRAVININPSLECNNITCNQESCLTFSQCSSAFGKTVALCQDLMAFSSSSSSVLLTVSSASIYLIHILEISIS